MMLFNLKKSFTILYSEMSIQNTDYTCYDAKITCHNRTVMVNKCPFINGPFAQSLRQTQILILEILQCIPVVKIFAFLDLERNGSFLDEH